MILTRASSLGAMTFLIFLARAAWAWVVAPDFRMVADDGTRFARILASGCGGGVGFSEGQMAAAWAALQPLLGRLLDGDLQVIERAHGLDVDAVEHPFKKVERLLLVFDQRVFLRVAHLVDPLFQMVNRLQVIFPL